MKKRFYTVILAFLITSQVFLPMAIPATMGIQIDMLLSQVRTNAGGSLSGGRVYFYAAGTSTPKDVYLDINKNTAAANPYTLDSNGTAYLFGDGLYRIVIKTAAGVTAYDRDNIRYEDLIRGASGTPDNTTYLRGDNSWYKLPRYFSTDAFTDNLTLYANDAILKGPWVDVRAYGAVGDGTTDDTAAIQAAIDNATAGNTLLFPIGTYKFSKLNWNKQLKLKGMGYWCNTNAAFGNAQWTSASPSYGGTVLKSTATTDNAITITVPVDYGNIGLSDFILVGPGSGTSIGISIGDNVTSPKLDISDVMVANFSLGWRVKFVEDSLVKSWRSRGCSTGMWVSDASNQCVFINTEVQFSSVDAIKFETSNGSQWLGGLLQNSIGTGWNLAGSKNTVSGFWFENPGITRGLISSGSNHVIEKSYVGSDNDSKWDINSSTTLLLSNTSMANGNMQNNGQYNTYIDTDWNTNFTDNGIGTIRHGTGIYHGSMTIDTAYKFNSDYPNPTNATAAFYNQAGIGPTISGGAFQVRVGSTPAMMLQVAADGVIIGGPGTSTVALTWNATASVSDNGAISHLSGTTPKAVICTPSIAAEMCSVTALGTTTFTVAIKKNDGTAGTTQTIYWIALK